MTFPDARYCAPSDPCKGQVDSPHSHGPDGKQLSIAPRVIERREPAFDDRSSD